MVILINLDFFETKVNFHARKTKANLNKKMYSRKYYKVLENRRLNDSSVLKLSAIWFYFGSVS